MNFKDWILYEDKDVIAINKPAGLQVHADGRTKEKTLADFILEEYPEMKEVGEPMTLQNGEIIYRPGIVHRLDKETSGVLVIAKNQPAFEFLKNQFQEREIKKTYQTIVWGHVKDDRGRVEKAIGRSPNDFRRWSAGRGARGEMREAVTEYKVLKRFRAGKRSDLENSERSDLGEAFTLVEVRPQTGRTHQIRVHFKYLNHPVVCDKLYAPNNACPVLGLGRLALHAEALEFELPSGKRLKVEAPLPADFKGALAKAEIL
jgi:23S rRNA pseudouridine1911/1915/1917 synthase